MEISSVLKIIILACQVNSGSFRVQASYQRTCQKQLIECYEKMEYSNDLDLVYCLSLRKN